MNNEYLVALAAYEEGIPYNGTYCHNKGHRQGELDGYAVEVRDGWLQLVEYGPAGHADGRYPYGTRRTVLKERPLFR